MDLGIAGKTALVTGASSGLGEAVALGLAREGVRLLLAARRLDRLETVAERAREIGAPAARAVLLDLQDSGSVASAVAEISGLDASPDIVVLNGGGPKAGRFSDLSLAEWDGAYQLLLRGMVELLHAVTAPMRAKRWGRIVALTSTSVKRPIDNLLLSNAFRTALVATLRTLAVEGAPDGVTVNSIATGRIETDRLRSLYGNDDAKLKAAGAEVPLGRIAAPHEFAPLAVFLCGRPAGYVTGQTISVDGGLTRGLFG